MSVGTTTPRTFSVLAKPTGAVCNLDCAYCFFLKKESLYPGSSFRMSDAVLEAYIRQYIESQRGPEVTIAWQGGEPTLMGVDFFRRSVELAQKYRRAGTTLRFALQTNGTLLDDDWAAFFREHGFLIGISLDGPREMHDAFRVGKGGRPSFNRVMRGLRFLKKHAVELNVLATVHAANASRPIDVYRFLRDEIGAQFIQLIPIVERENESGFQEGNTVTTRSVRAEQWGALLIAIFDEWVRRDVSSVFVQIFEAALASWVGVRPGLCIFEETCGEAMAVEHTGDLYACDHYVEPRYLLGNIMETPLAELAASLPQRQFGNAKRDTLPPYCLDCEVLFACHGECPKNRFIRTPNGDPGLNYLCAGYRAFFNHIDRPMRIMASLVRQGRSAGDVMRQFEAAEAESRPATARPGRNDPCPCGSGQKFKRCHGASLP